MCSTLCGTGVFFFFSGVLISKCDVKLVVSVGWSILIRWNRQIQVEKFSCTVGVGSCIGDLGRLLHGIEGLLGFFSFSRTVGRVWNCIILDWYFNLLWNKMYILYTNSHHFAAMFSHVLQPSCSFSISCRDTLTFYFDELILQTLLQSYCSLVGIVTKLLICIYIISFHFLRVIF